MPNRILREGIIESEAVNLLSPGAEVLYRRLMSKVDDYGRFHGNPALILAACFPLQLDRVSQANVSEWLAECAQMSASGEQAIPLMDLYEYEGKKYIQINNFGQRTRTDSKFPPPSVRDVLTNARKCPQMSARTRAHSEASAESDAYSESESEASAAAETAPPKTALAPVPIRADFPKDLEARIRALADTAPDQQDYLSGVQCATEAVRSAVHPERCLVAMEASIPLWYEAMRDGRARTKTLRYLIVDNDWTRRPREPTKPAAQKTSFRTAREQQIHEELMRD